MPEITNNTKLNLDTSFDVVDNRETMIKIDNVSMKFNMASEQLNNLKEYFLSIVNHNLFYEELTALDQVSFEIKRGDVFGIVGTNGSGKSTLLKIVAGVLEPSSGKVEINGGIAPLIELGAGFDMDLSARENIYLNGALLGYSKDFINQHFDAIVEFAEVEKFLDMPMKNYSSGMVARIAFAIATVIVPEILIVDEVLSVGDFMFQKKCEDRIMELIEQHNTTVLIVSHSNDQIARLCNKAIWIEKGKTRMIGNAQKVCEIYGLIGGRTGSLDAEKTIIETAQKCSDTNTDDVLFVTHGNTYPQITLDIAKRAKNTAPNALVLASDAVHINAAVGNAIAGALDCPLLTIPGQDVDHHIIDYIKDTKPEKLVVLNAANQNGPKNFIEADFGYEPEIHITNDEGTALEFCLHCAEALYEKNKLGHIAILANFEDSCEVVSPLSRFIYDNKCPVLLVRQEDEKNVIAITSLLKRCDISKVIICGTKQSKTIIDAIKNLNIEIQDIVAKTHWEACANIATSLVSSNVEEVVISPLTLASFSTSASVGYYASRKNAACLSVDETSLDSIASTLKFLKKHNCKMINCSQASSGISWGILRLFARVAKANKSK